MRKPNVQSHYTSCPGPAQFTIPHTNTQQHLSLTHPQFSRYHHTKVAHNWHATRDARTTAMYFETHSYRNRYDKHRGLVNIAPQLCCLHSHQSFEQHRTTFEKIDGSYAAVRIMSAVQINRMNGFVPSYGLNYVWTFSLVEWRIAGCVLFGQECHRIHKL